MNFFKKKSSTKPAASAAAASTNSGGGTKKKKQAIPIVSGDQFVDKMVTEWEELNIKLTKVPEEDWEYMRDEMVEVTDRLYDMKDYPDDYKRNDLMTFQTNEFQPMMEEVNDIVRESLVRYLNEVDPDRDCGEGSDFGGGTVLENWRYCKAYVDERRTMAKGLRKLQDEIEIANAKSDRLEKSAMIMSDEAVKEHLDELDAIVRKVKPLVDKADLKDYITIRNKEERFIQGCNKAINELIGYGYESWAYFKEDLDVLQEHMARLQQPFESKEEADEHIASTKAVLKIVKKEIKVIRAQKEEEEQRELQKSQAYSKKKIMSLGRGKVPPRTNSSSEVKKNKGAPKASRDAKKAPRKKGTTPRKKK
eukprot:scaffold7064_cov111-Cylindrotheca_fusiformis.AAC.1